jgi:hypothetical protein
VHRRVEVEQDEPLHLQVLFADRRPVPDDRGLLLAGVDVAAAGHLQDVRVPGDHPVALVVETGGAARLRVPPDRGHPAQFGEFLGWHPGHVHVRIGEVEAGGNVRLGHRFLRCNVF